MSPTFCCVCCCWCWCTLGAVWCGRALWATVECSVSMCDVSAHNVRVLRVLLFYAKFVLIQCTHLIILLLERFFLFVVIVIAACCCQSCRFGFLRIIFCLKPFPFSPLLSFIFLMRCTLSVGCSLFLLLLFAYSFRTSPSHYMCEN